VLPTAYNSRNHNPLNSVSAPIEAVETMQANGSLSHTFHVYLGLGSSLGDRMQWLRKACEGVQALSVTGSLVCSTVYQTPHMRLDPEDRAVYPDHLNAVVSFETWMQPHGLLAELQSVERGCGRLREAGKRWQPRTLDIDILLFGELAIQDSQLTVPHPGIAHRRFVLQPLLELLPDLLLADGRWAAEVLASDAIQSQPIEEFADASKLLL
jgi:2-amino-4-hydroxy-6-hydroxymethyldihydropteridine diphosphokinase